jgi:peptidoglycan L-alanyl-D-glutamate endopeptidase CwlK
MRDLISVPRVELLHPAVREEVKKLIYAAELNLPLNAKIRVVQGLRTKQEQDDLFSLGRTKPGKIVTNARFGQSFHCYGLAIDFALMYDKDGNGSYETLSWDVNYDMDKDGIKDWMEVVSTFEPNKWTWGGRFKSIQDDPHLEKTFGYSWRELLEKYNKKDFIKGSLYVNL